MSATCARLIMGQPKNRAVAFRVPRRKRDGAIPFRTHITKRHEALRLMFWQATNGVVELANIGGKSEQLIFEGDAARVITRSY